MDRTLTNFIGALRNSEVRISTAETLDAFNAVELVGYRDRAALKRSLALVLPKTADEKATFDVCFDQFFSFDDVSAERTAGDAQQAGEEQHQEGGEGQGGGGGGGEREASEGQDSGDAKGKKKKNKKRKEQNLAPDDEEEEDLGPGAMTDASSALGELLMSNSKVELSMAMAQAGEAVNLRDIEVFTQKGLYTRKIMEAMGLGGLNREISELRRSRSTPERRLGQELTRRREAAGGCSPERPPPRTGTA